jgi:hypothetical protein
MLTRKKYSARKLTFEISLGKRVRLNETRFDPENVVPDISQPQEYRHYFDTLYESEIGRYFDALDER